MSDGGYETHESAKEMELRVLREMNAEIVRLRAEVEKQKAVVRELAAVARAARASQDARNRANRYVMRVGEYIGQEWKKATHFDLYDKSQAAAKSLDAALAALSDAAREEIK